MLSFFPRGVLDEILNLIESVSEDFPSYFCIDHIAEYHMHTVIICNIEEPQQKYRTGTVSNRLLGGLNLLTAVFNQHIWMTTCFGVTYICYNRSTALERPVLDFLGGGGGGGGRC